MPFDGSHINFAIAFVAGFISFLAPCTIAIIPVQIGYLGSLSLAEIELPAKNTSRFTSPAFRNSLWYVVGFLLVFLLMGVTVNSIARILVVQRPFLLRMLGIVFIVMGLHMLGLLKVKRLSRPFQFSVPKHIQVHQEVFSLLLGITFALAWSPCIGPVLAVILFLASQQDSSTLGAFYLFLFGLGMAVPFVIVSLFVNEIGRYLKGARQFTKYLYLFSGAVTLVLGILLLTNNIAVFYRFSGM